MVCDIADRFSGLRSMEAGEQATGAEDAGLLQEGAGAGSSDDALFRSLQPLPAAPVAEAWGRLR
jgi:hypothetical protein